MKKEKSPIIVILCIVFLSTFIILPPTFRSLIPKNNSKKENNTSSNMPKLVVINCNKTYPNELYQVNSKTKFVNNTQVNVITYQKLDSLPDNYTPAATNGMDTTTTAESEIAYFKSLVGIEMEEQEKIVRFTIDNNLIKSNPMDNKLVNYLTSDPDLTRINFENMGYTCNKMES